MKVDSVSNPGLAQSISQKKFSGIQRSAEPGAMAASKPSSSRSAGAVRMPAIGSSTCNSNVVHEGLSHAERAFFAKLFPDASSRINSHSTSYSAGGPRPTVELGQIINRKA